MELALALPVVLVLILTVLQMGLVARDVVLVTHAAREAARAASVDSSTGAARVAAVASSGLAEDRLVVTVTGRQGAGSHVRTEVVYRSRTTVPVIGALLGDRVVRASATIRVETDR